METMIDVGPHSTFGVHEIVQINVSRSGQHRGGIFLTAHYIQHTVALQVMADSSRFDGIKQSGATQLQSHFIQMIAVLLREIESIDFGLCGDEHRQQR